jgi:hypothetical protein
MCTKVPISGDAWWRRDDYLIGSNRGKSVRHGHSRNRGLRLVETLGWRHRAVLCVMCYAPRRGERGLMLQRWLLGLKD